MDVFAPAVRHQVRHSLTAPFSEATSALWKTSAWVATRKKRSAAMAMWKLGGLALAAVLTAGSAIGQASAMPASGLATAAVATNGVQDVRYVCGPYRCWWRPGGYYYGPRYYNYYVGPRHWYWHRRYW
jgi:hypothetical protein